MHELILLQDMAIVMAVSAAVTVLCHRWNLPVVLGYILAGVIIGPHTPPFPLIHDLVSIRTLSELGVIFLLFGIGLEFSLSKLMRVGLVSVFGASIEIVFMTWLGFSVGQAFGWRAMDSLFLGAILSVSSTTIIAKVLMDMKKLEEPFAHVILGILIIEDLLAIVIIALLSGLAATGAITLEEAGIATLRVAAFVAGALVLGLWWVPRLLRYFERFRSSELMVITTLGLCFGLSLIAARLGFSVALGAFLMGAIIAETPQAKEIIHRIEPIRDMFTAIFFVSVGMLLDPQVLVQFAWPIAAIVLATIIGKVVSISFATFLSGYAPETSLRVGLGLSQIGEFSFIIARLGEATAVTSGFLYPIAVSVSGVTTLTTPILMRNTPRIVAFLTRWAPRPLVTLGSLYMAWLERLKGVKLGSERQRAIAAGLRVQVPLLALYVGGTIGAMLLAARFAGGQALPPVLYWGGVSALMLPLLFAVAYTVDRIIWKVIVLNLMPGDESGSQAGLARDVLHNLLRFLSVLVSGLGLLALSAPFIPVGSFGAAFVALVAAASLVLWGSARKLHQRVERTVVQLFEREQPAEEIAFKQSHDALVQLIREEYPWEVETQDLLLPYQESAVNRSIKDLRLRSVTGASIVSIYRGAEPIINPPPESVLLPGDVLLLMGSHEQVAAAIRFLQQKTHEPSPGSGTADVRTRQIIVAAGSRWAGKTIAEINLRSAAEVQVVGVQQAGLSITNPDGAVRIEPGGTLVLFGRSDQLDRAAAYLTTTEERP